jgi:hypothetical protein
MQWQRVALDDDCALGGHVRSQEYRVTSLIVLTRSSSAGFLAGEFDPTLPLILLASFWLPYAGSP